MVNPEISSLQKRVESQIVAVTVYSDRALVTRRGSVSLTGLERELVISPLPLTLETESVRVSGTGTVGVQLLGVSSDRLYTSEPVAERVAQLTRQIQQLEAEKRHLQAQVDALALQSSFIDGLREKTQEPFAQSLSRKNLSLSETLDFLNFLGSQYGEYAIASGECKSQQQELDKQLQALRTALQTIQTPHPKESLSLIVGIAPSGEGEFELELSYIVNRASWTPLYDLRVDSTSNIVHLSYLAEVSQSTGEDWINVALTLSTAKPGLGTLPPKLQPWYIDTPSPPPMVRRRQLTASPSLPTLAAPDAEANWQEDEVAEDSLISAEIVVAEVSKQGSVVTFQLSGGGNIPSDGTPHKTTIFNDDYPCSFNYVAMPRLVSFVYLQANVKNSSNGATLLLGKANIFRDNIFVGTTKLENIAPGQEFKLNLGIDEGLKIERELVERQVDKKLMSNQRRITYSYRLVITNLLNQETNLTITEQLPVSRNEQIKVRLIRSNPQIQLGEMAILEWVLTIPPNEKREISYQFTLEYPPELTVIGLDI
ncbi:mucoidy inhibitor MuiA family protein [Nostocaceae cyanobacterium CENA369]|uniref:Mucoidy inhibitor MuiA family protein n=1 Tax=Dendronalium phyllosphericum CENA369 TaxID=1725256 RepID=A0A8J7I3P6_9NOST|nr:mucoidy inhibitor MuiA family protein [Dendronalium phyllosphericum]MBH8575295.1 mucoidy inhibitor MuiA family protein [Dendronalium phyllosphericum CENA369]